jgi:hypothetical protein
MIFGIILALFTFYLLSCIDTTQCHGLDIVLTYFAFFIGLIIDIYYFIIFIIQPLLPIIYL